MAEQIKPTVYVETTIPSYLTAWRRSDMLLATHQKMTHEWWQLAPQKYDLFISQTVLDEASRGDPTAVTERLNSLRNLIVLSNDPEVVSLAAQYERVLQLPPKALNDSVHLSYAVVFELDYLVT